MGRILDPDWRQFEYVPAAKTDLKTSMERYKEMVRGESQRLHPEPQKAGDGRGVDQKVPSKPNNCLQGHKLVVIRGKT